MNTPRSALPDEILGLRCSALSGGDVSSCDRIRGGNNNRIYRVTTRDGRQLVVKFYFSHPSDKRDRLGTEYGALSFMWQNDVRCIPEPLGNDLARGAAVYSFIEGEKRDHTALTRDDMRAAATFVQKLHGVSSLSEAVKISPASEAYFSLGEVIANIEQRFQKLLGSRAGANPAQGQLEEFLPRLERFFAEVKNWIEGSEGGPQELTTPLSEKLRVLSPSDFGFHNALLTPDGNWVFLDFEYFGRDDPSKLMSDFLLHPGMQLGYPLQCAFLQNVLPVFGPSSELLTRFEHAYALYTAKWCLIILNEFVPEFLARRGFASMQAESLEKIQLRQLTKAKTLIDTVAGHYKSFRKHFGVDL